MIQINDDWGLDSDRLQFILMKKSIIQDEKSENFGKEVWKNEAYLPKIEDVLRYLITHEIKENMENGIEVIVEAVYDMQKIFSKLLEAEKQKTLQTV